MVKVSPWLAATQSNRNYLDAEGDYIEWSDNPSQAVPKLFEVAWRGKWRWGALPRVCHFDIFLLGAWKELRHKRESWLSHVMVEVGFWFLQLLHFSLKPCPPIPTLQIMRPFSLSTILHSLHMWLYLTHSMSGAAFLHSRRRSECLRSYACRNDADSHTSNRDDASGCTGDPKYFVSPTDGIETPCTRKLRAAKKKHFDKYAIF